MGRHSTAIPPEAPKPSLIVETITPPPSPSSKKRKRDAESAAEIEVDINAPEPPSKKALRKAKKAQGTVQPANSTYEVHEQTNAGENQEQDASELERSPKHSDYAIWIGNLSWMTTKNELRNFFERNMADGGTSITRTHLPPPSQTSLVNSKQKIKPVNKGFAYIDFATQEALAEALGLSEKLFSGRKVLIKNAKDFEGRPEKPDESQVRGPLSGKPPSKRVFVGNLSYDATREDIREHFTQCGEVDDVFLTTFEDSGKCKGFGWVTFAELEAAQAAVRGWVDFVSNPDDESENSGKDEEVSQTEDNGGESQRTGLKKRRKLERPKRPRKWWVNKFQGRPLRMEYAEGKDVRYKKRYGKGGTAALKESGEKRHNETTIDGESNSEQVAKTSANRHELKKKKVDARTIKPGAALAAAPRLTGGIVESKGKKTKFS